MRRRRTNDLPPYLALFAVTLPLYGGHNFRSDDLSPASPTPRDPTSTATGLGRWPAALQWGLVAGLSLVTTVPLEIAGFPAAFVGVLFTGGLLIETMFSLDGLGLLGFEAALRRDYPVVFGTLYVFTLIGLALKLVSDLTYMLVDPRIDFERR